MRFKNQVAVVTGAGHGIGRAVAERFAAEGARVIVNDLDQSRADEVAQAIGGIAIAADVSIRQQVDAMFDRVLAEAGPVDVLVNAIVPGLIRSYDLTEEAAVERGKVVPMGRLGSPEDLAGPTVFLATDDARYITGTCLVVDGGVLVQQRSPAVETFPIERFP